MKKAIRTFMITMVLTLVMASPIAGKKGTLDVNAAAYKNSGRSAVAKLSWGQLAALYDSVPSYSTLYSKAPVVVSGKYAAGTLSTEAGNTALAGINYYRRVAGVGNITFTSALSTSASHGALVNAANNVLSHTPSKPSNMSQSMYDTAYLATTKSNISCASGYGATEIIGLALKGQMADATSSNLSSVGHRRWLLNPNAAHMGIGSANNSTTYYTAIRVSGDGTAGSTVNDYDFISWPASGNNLSDTFAVNTPWSITLNPNKYGTPNRSNITVTLTQCSNNQKWTFNNSTGTTNSKTANYFNVNTNRYAVNNCIIFRPAYSTLVNFSGDYIVTVSGLTTKAGAATTLSYKVSFEKRSNITAATDFDLTSMATASSEGSQTTTQAAPTTRNNTILIPNTYTKTVSKSVQKFTLKPAAYGNPSFTYKSNNPYITVNASGVVTIGKNYVGKAIIRITSAKTGNYNATTKMITIAVCPSKTNIQKAKSAAKKSLTVSWAKNPYASGYQVMCSSKKNFTANKKVVNISNAKLSCKIKGLASKKVSYVKVRAFKNIGGNIFYGPWSVVKSSKIK